LQIFALMDAGVFVVLDEADQNPKAAAALTAHAQAIHASKMQQQQQQQQQQEEEEEEGAGGGRAATASGPALGMTWNPLKGGPGTEQIDALASSVPTFGRVRKCFLAVVSFDSC